MAGTRKVGRLRLTEERLDKWRSELMNHYQGNAVFMAQLLALWDRYKRLLRALVQGRTGRTYGAHRASQPQFAWDAAKRVANGRPTFTKSGTMRGPQFTHLRRYFAEIQELTRRWGLRSAWAEPWLHTALAEPFMLTQFGDISDSPRLIRSIWTYIWTGSDDKIALAIEVEDHETWDEVQKRILARARPQWDAIQARWEKRPDWGRQDTRPELRRHIRWLYLRICPQPDTGRPLSWGSIARREHIGVTTVTRVVKALAGEMGIDLPKVAAGRPSSFSE